jgi:hypothetical protein
MEVHSMNIASARAGTFERGDDRRFTGDVWLRGTLTADDATNVAVVQFSPGARTHWHRHAGGQFLYAEWHFHGARPDSPMMHVAVNGAGDPEWGDPVTDEEFEESF